MRLAIESNMIAVGGRSRQTALRQVAASASRHVCHKSASWRRGRRERQWGCDWASTSLCGLTDRCMLLRLGFGSHDHSSEAANRTAATPK